MTLQSLGNISSIVGGAISLILFIYVVIDHFRSRRVSRKILEDLEDFKSKYGVK